MNLPEYNTTRCESYLKFWRYEDDNRFACRICGEPWPNKVRVYYDDTRICGDKHANFHQTYQILNELEHELLGDHFNALTITLKLSEEGII